MENPIIRSLERAYGAAPEKGSAYAPAARAARAQVLRTWGALSARAKNWFAINAWVNSRRGHMLREIMRASSLGNHRARCRILGDVTMYSAALTLEHGGSITCDDMYVPTDAAALATQCRLLR